MAPHQIIFYADQIIYAYGCLCDRLISVQHFLVMSNNQCWDALCFWISSMVVNLLLGGNVKLFFCYHTSEIYFCQA